MARSNIGTKFERFNYAPKNAISIANYCSSCSRTHSSRAQRSPFLPLPKRKNTSTVHRVVMCVGDKGTVCRHLWILRVLHAAPSDSPPFLQLQCMNSRDTRRWTFDPRGRATRQFWVISFIKGGLIIVFVAHKE